MPSSCGLCLQNQAFILPRPQTHTEAHALNKCFLEICSICVYLWLIFSRLSRALLTHLGCAAVARSIAALICVIVSATRLICCSASVQLCCSIASRIPGSVLTP